MATQVHAPMVGKVVELLVPVGEMVEEDEPVLVLEALKMKMPVVAPVAGTLEQYCVAEGQVVQGDAVLAIIAE